MEKAISASRKGFVENQNKGVGIIESHKMLIVSTLPVNPNLAD